ncbi:phage portal protein [Streptomyces mirabilis]|uniref:phage portal protein n=1 Tax=Streptomyces mirabilis TaxID=68239 RepID=UPI00332994D6
MARWNPFRRTPLDQPDATKAISPASVPAATFSPDQVTSLINAASSAGRQIPGVANPLPRTDPAVAFGPGMPLFPASIDPVRPDTGRPEPRFNEYPVSSNLPGVSDRLVPWKVLRDAADAGGLPRRCIEIRKAEVTTLDWTITLTKQAVEAAQSGTSKPRSEVDQALRQRMSPEIVRCTRFWEKPDRGQDEDFSEWLSKLLEEHLVLDAVAIYPRLTYGGDLYALEILDGSTIKPLRDHRGGRPAAPQPAFQQILWGFPRGEFVADTDDEGAVLNGFAADRLVYKRRNVRAHTPYGYSAVEQALEDVDVWLRRRKWIRDEYTEGTIPTGLLLNEGTSGWTPAQTLEYETYLNDTYAGSSAARHRLRVLPPGLKPTTEPDVAERYKPEYDLFLIKQIASHFDVTIAELGFTETGGLGSAGWHEGQADVQQRKGTLPTLRWLQQLLTSVSRTHLGMPPELEFRFLGLEEEDEAAADQVAQNRIQWGRMTLNEDRDRLGQPRYDFAEADKPMMMTSRGMVFVEGASERVPPGTLSGPAKAVEGGGASEGEVVEEPASEDDTGAGGGEKAEARDDAVKAELAAFNRWARRNPNASRPFVCEVLTKADVPDLDGNARIVFATPGADVSGPKAPDLASARDWPGWEPDLKAVAYWTPRIRKTMRTAIDTRRLAEQWIAERAITVKADEPDPSGVERAGGDEAVIRTDHDATGWLTAHGVDLGTALVFIHQLHAEGYVIGERSASAVVAGHASVDWSTWKPGHSDAARLVAPTGAANGLETLLADAGITIRSVAANRMDKLAQVLSDALARGDSADTLAVSLRDVLDDPAWAERIAVTEISRAVSAATLNIYQANGITQISWLTAPDQRTCVICINNESAGAIPVGANFPSGAPAPPQHPSCRCCLLPETSSF